MPASRRTPSKTKTQAKSASAMSSSQKTIYNKLRKKGLSEKQAEAFSKHAAKRKDAAAAKKSGAKAVGVPKKTSAAKRKPAKRKTVVRGKKK